MANKRNDFPQHKAEQSRKCVLAFYHIGALLLLIGIIVAVVGVSSKLFRIYVFDQRRPALFHHIIIKVGLFNIVTEIKHLNNKWSESLHPLVLKEPRWNAAKAFSVLGMCFGIVAFIVHAILIYKRNHRLWQTTLMEVLCILGAVIGILTGLSLAESEMEDFQSHCDACLVEMLKANDLLQQSALISRPSQPQENKSGRNATAGLSSAEFDLLPTVTQSGFYVLIAADFILLLAFLAVLIMLVRVCEEEEERRKQLQKAKVTPAKV